MRQTAKIEVRHQEDTIEIAAIVSTPAGEEINIIGMTVEEALDVTAAILGEIVKMRRYVLPDDFFNIDDMRVIHLGDSPEEER